MTVRQAARQVAFQAALLLVAVGVGARPALAALPYAQAVCAGMPTTGLTGGVKLDPQLFPDFWPGQAVEAQYAEYSTSAAQSFALVTLRSQRTGYLALLFYAPPDICYITLHELPLPLAHLTTLTFQLPSDAPDGYTRLLVWQDKPRADMLALLARDAAAGGQPLAGLAAQRWFPRVRPAVIRLPWEDPFRPRPLAHFGFSRQPWPFCRAALETSNTVRAKDCAVDYSGKTALQIDEYGSQTRWQIGLGSRFEMRFELPPGLRISEARLLLYGKWNMLYQYSAPPALSVSVNGWRLNATGNAGFYSLDTQPLTLQLSQYLDAGENVIEVLPDVFGAVEWNLDSVELWLQ